MEEYLAEKAVDYEVGQLQRTVPYRYYPEASVPLEYLAP